MPLFAQRDFSNLYISRSYQDVVQRFDTGSTEYFLDGLGYVIASLPSASLGFNIITSDQTASYAFASVVAQVADVALIADTSSVSVFAETASIADTTLVADFAVLAGFTDSASLAQTTSFVNGPLNGQDNWIDGT